MAAPGGLDHEVEIGHTCKREATDGHARTRHRIPIRTRHARMKTESRTGRDNENADKKRSRQQKRKNETKIEREGEIETEIERQSEIDVESYIN